MDKACLLLLLLGTLALAPVTVRAASLDNELFIGTEALLRGRFELASQSFAQALALDPDNPYARTRLGLALWGAGQAAKARAELEKALAVRADDIFALWSLGCLDLLAGQPAAAAGRFAALAKADPGNIRSTLGLGLAALEDGRTAEGVGLLATVQQTGSDDALVRFLCGYAYWLINAPANARLELERSLELAPRSTASLELLGLVYHRQGQPQLAASAWGQALAIDPQAKGARFFLSRLAEDEGLAAALADRPAEAKRAYERALAADPGNAAAAKALGLAIMPPLTQPGEAKEVTPRLVRPSAGETSSGTAVAKKKVAQPDKAAGKGTSGENAAAASLPAATPTETPGTPPPVPTPPGTVEKQAAPPVKKPRKAKAVDAAATLATPPAPGPGAAPTETPATLPPVPTPPGAVEKPAAPPVKKSRKAKAGVTAATPPAPPAAPAGTAPAGEGVPPW